MREIKISKNEAGQKLKKFCFYYFKGVPQSFTFKMLRKKNILLNDKKAGGDELLVEGDRVQLYFSDETLSSLRKEAEMKQKLPKLSDYPWFTKDRVLYEDDDMLILDKPFGILTQKATARDRSVMTAFLLTFWTRAALPLRIWKPSGPRYVTGWTGIPAGSWPPPNPNREPGN